MPEIGPLLLFGDNESQNAIILEIPYAVIDPYVEVSDSMKTIKLSCKGMLSFASRSDAS